MVEKIVNKVDLIQNEKKMKDELQRGSHPSDDEDEGMERVTRMPAASSSCSTSVGWFLKTRKY